jgi:hypothetical protein
MKLKPVQFTISLLVGMLLAYGFFSFKNGENKILLTVGSFVFLSITLLSIISVDYKRPRITTNIRVVSGIFFLLALLSNVLFCILTFTTPTYIIVNGILLLLFILIVFSIKKTDI